MLGGVFEVLNLERMVAADGALREGLLYDLIGRIRSEDVRNRTIRIFQSRYNVDRDFAARVERTVLQLFDQGREVWDFLLSGAEVPRWATQLHEIGLSVSHPATTDTEPTYFRLRHEGLFAR